VSQWIGHSTYRIPGDIFGYIWDDEDGSRRRTRRRVPRGPDALSHRVPRRLTEPEGLYVPVMDDLSMRAIRDRRGDVAAWFTPDGRVVSKFGEHMGWLAGVRLLNARDQHVGWFGDGWFLDYRGGKTASLDAEGGGPGSPVPPSTLENKPARPATDSLLADSVPVGRGWSEHSIAGLLR
jgi:hypothetical protein